MALDPVALRFACAQLGPDVLLSNISANITGPGGDHEIGRLHTDQGFFPEPWPQVVATNVAWFLDDFTEANGATLVVPGSHRVVGYPPHDLEPQAPARLTGPAGSCAVVDGRLHHATGLNRTRDRATEGDLRVVRPSLPPDPGELDPLPAPRGAGRPSRAGGDHRVRRVDDARWGRRARNVGAQFLDATARGERRVCRPRVAAVMSPPRRVSRGASTHHDVSGDQVHGRNALRREDRHRHRSRPRLRALPRARLRATRRERGDRRLRHGARRHRLRRVGDPGRGRRDPCRRRRGHAGLRQRLDRDRGAARGADRDRHVRQARRAGQQRRASRIPTGGRTRAPSGSSA